MFLGNLRDLPGASVLERAGAFQHQRSDQHQRQESEPRADAEKLLEFRAFAAECNA